MNLKTLPEPPSTKWCRLFIWTVPLRVTHWIQSPERTQMHLLATPWNTLRLISLLHAPLSPAVALPHPPANHSAYWRARECRGYLFDLNLNFKTPSLHFPLFNQLFMESANASKGARMASKHSGSPELDSLFLTHNLWVYMPCLSHKCLPRTLRATGGGGGEKEGCLTGERAARDKGTELERWLQKQKGMRRGLADGGRWEVGCLGEAEGWRGEDGRCRHKEDERQAVRQTANGEQQAASVINCSRPMRDSACGAAAWPQQDIVLRQ